MRIPSISTLCISTLLFGLTASGCSMAYKSYYKQTQGTNARPVAAKSVKVVKSRSDLNRGFDEVGIYRGKAPTVAEAMDAAKDICGQHGADLYILNVEPFASEGGWKVDGICARSQG